MCVCLFVFTHHHRKAQTMKTRIKTKEIQNYSNYTEQRHLQQQQQQQNRRPKQKVKDEVGAALAAIDKE